MAIDERITEFSDKELAALHENIVRLAQSGSAKQQAEAARLMPLVDAELAARKARAPVKPARKTATKAKKAVAPDPA